MHEGVYTEQIVQAILEGLKQHPEGKVLKARIRVGEMLHLQPEAVKLHFDSITRGTRLQGAELEMAEEHVKVRCRACKAESEPADHHLLVCRACESRDVEVLAGRGVRVESVDLEG